MRGASPGITSTDFAPIFLQTWIARSTDELSPSWFSSLMTSNPSSRAILSAFLSTVTTTLLSASFESPTAENTSSSIT